jgi:hypothetical protein
VHVTIDVVHVLLFFLSFLLRHYFLSSGSSRGRFGTGRGGNFRGDGMRGRGNYNGGRSYGRGDFNYRSDYGGRGSGRGGASRGGGDVRYQRVDHSGTGRGTRAPSATSAAAK